MRKRSDFIALSIVTLLFSYAISIGATFNGIVTVEIHNLTFALISLTAAGWLLVHWRNGWAWHRTPLDGVFVLWGIAFGASLLTNTESWRRVAIGLWYVGLYVGVWYILADAIGNKGLKRETLVDGLLISGLVVLIFGYVQARDWLASTMPLVFRGMLPFNLPRPVSTLGNTNSLANFLVVVIPFALARTVTSRRRFNQIVMGVYAGMAIVLLFLTFSRGGWVGIAAGVGAWFLLLLVQHDLLTVDGIQRWWVARDRIVKAATVIVGGAALVTATAGVVIFLLSFQMGGRSASLRTGIWADAITLFSEKPLAGHGLFTFGAGLSRLYSTPPNTPHSHAHNVLLHIAAELGIVGLVTLGATLFVIVMAARKNWREMDNRQRGTLAGAVGAVVAFAVHQLADLPAMSPAIALSGLVALTLVMIPVSPVPLTSTFRRTGHPVAMTGLWIVLIGTGLWSSNIYRQYVSIRNEAMLEENFREAADEMQAVIAADPSLSLYYKEQGLLLGLAANEGDLDAAREGIRVYDQFIALNPEYAIVWANKAALHWQLGEQEAGLGAMRTAVELSPLSWQLAVNLGNYEDALGNTEAALLAYDRAIQLSPDIVLMPDLEQVALRQTVMSTENPLSIRAQVVNLLDNGQVEQAKVLWVENAPSGSTSKYVIDMVLALAEGDRDGAQTALESAVQVAASRVEQTWALVGQARLAQFDGDDEAAEGYISAARENLRRGVFDADYVGGLSIAYAHFLRLGFPRQFIPQVYYPVDDPVLLHLLEGT